MRFPTVFRQPLIVAVAAAVDISSAVLAAIAAVELAVVPVVVMVAFAGSGVGVVSNKTDVHAALETPGRSVLEVLCSLAAVEAVAFRACMYVCMYVYIYIYI